MPSTLSFFENGRDVTAYFTIGMVETPALFSIHRNKCLTRKSKKDTIIFIETHYMSCPSKRDYLCHYQLLSDDGGHDIIDNFEFPCNSMENLISIWNLR